MQDDRWHCPSRDELIAALDKLLETPRAKSNGGYPDVSFDRMWEVDKFFHLVRKAVMEPDPDGDMVITWEMLHRGHHRMPASGMRIPHHIESKEDLRSWVATAQSLVGAGAELLRMVDYHISDEIRADRAAKEAADLKATAMKELATV